MLSRPDDLLEGGSSLLVQLQICPSIKPSAGTSEHISSWAPGSEDFVANPVSLSIELFFRWPFPQLNQISQKEPFWTPITMSAGSEDLYFSLLQHIFSWAGAWLWPFLEALFCGHFLKLSFVAIYSSIKPLSAPGSGNLQPSFSWAGVPSSGHKFWRTHLENSTRF